MREKGMNIPTIPVMPTVMRPCVNREDGRVRKVLTESDETTEEPRAHAGKVILEIVRGVGMNSHPTYLGLKSEDRQAQENTQGNQPA